MLRLKTAGEVCSFLKTEHEYYRLVRVDIKGGFSSIVCGAVTELDSNPPVAGHCNRHLLLSFFHFVIFVMACECKCDLQQLHGDC